MDYEQLGHDQAESQQLQREELAKTLGREPTEEEFEDFLEAWFDLHMAQHLPEYERMKRWAEEPSDEQTLRDNPKLMARHLAGLL